MTNPNFKTVCAWCRMHMSGPPDAPNVSHGMCIECAARQIAEIARPTMRLPRDPNYPPDAAQCDECGGHGRIAAGSVAILDSTVIDVANCLHCDGRGWVPDGHPAARYCERPLCRNRIKPDSVAVYCSNECAMKDG